MSTKGKVHPDDVDESLAQHDLEVFLTLLVWLLNSLLEKPFGSIWW